MRKNKGRIRSCEKPFETTWCKCRIVGQTHEVKPSSRLLLQEHTDSHEF